MTSSCPTYDSIKEQLMAYMPNIATWIRQDNIDIAPDYFRPTERINGFITIYSKTSSTKLKSGAWVELDTLSGRYGLSAGEKYMADNICRILRSEHTHYLPALFVYCFFKGVPMNAGWNQWNRNEYDWTDIIKKAKWLRWDQECAQAAEEYSRLAKKELDEFRNFKPLHRTSRDMFAIIGPHYVLHIPLEDADEEYLTDNDSVRLIEKLEQIISSTNMRDATSIARSIISFFAEIFTNQNVVNSNFHVYEEDWCKEVKHIYTSEYPPYRTFEAPILIKTIVDDVPVTIGNEKVASCEQIIEEMRKILPRDIGLVLQNSIVDEKIEEDQYPYNDGSYDFHWGAIEVEKDGKAVSLQGEEKILFECLDEREAPPYEVIPEVFVYSFFKGMGESLPVKTKENEWWQTWFATGESGKIIAEEYSETALNHRFLRKSSVRMILSQNKHCNTLIPLLFEGKRVDFKDNVNEKTRIELDDILRKIELTKKENARDMAMMIMDFFMNCLKGVAIIEVQYSKKRRDEFYDKKEKEKELNPDREVYVKMRFGKMRIDLPLSPEEIEKLKKEAGDLWKKLSDF